MPSDDRYPCPCCGYLVFNRPPGSYDVCPICFWEDDIVQLAFPMMSGGANALSLYAAQQNFERIHVSEELSLPNVRAPLSEEQRDAGWRPFEPSKDLHLYWGSSDDRECWKRA